MKEDVLDMNDILICFDKNIQYNQSPFEQKTVKTKAKFKVKKRKFKL